MSGARHHPWNDGFNERLVALMDVRGKRPADLARGASMQRSSMVKITSGTSQPTIETFARFVVELDCTPEEALALLGLHTRNGKVAWPTPPRKAVGT